MNVQSFCALVSKLRLSCIRATHYSLFAYACYLGSLLGLIVLSSFDFRTSFTGLLITLFAIPFPVLLNTQLFVIHAYNEYLVVLTGICDPAYSANYVPDAPFVFLLVGVLAATGSEVLAYQGCGPSWMIAILATCPLVCPIIAVRLIHEYVRSISRDCGWVSLVHPASGD